MNVAAHIEEQRHIAFEIPSRLVSMLTLASSGEKTVALMKDNTINWVVLDTVMDSGIDGVDTYRKIQEIHPGQKAIIASGFSETKRVKRVQQLGAGAYIKNRIRWKNSALP
jgi:two-component system, cell cycle sensor histidine kinase and response regulator CckA